MADIKEIEMKICYWKIIATENSGSLAWIDLGIKFMNHDRVVYFLPVLIIPPPPLPSLSSSLQRKIIIIDHWPMCPLNGTELKVNVFSVISSCLFLMIIFVFLFVVLGQIRIIILIIILYQKNLPWNIIGLWETQYWPGVMHSHDIFQWNNPIHILLQSIIRMSLNLFSSSWLIIINAIHLYLFNQYSAEF